MNKKMLKLQLPTDPRWVNIVEQNIEEILTDHAYCEQKAASTAISIIIQFPEYQEVVEKMLDLAQEELDHFKQVHKIIIKRGYKLGFERKDEYVHQLAKFFKKGGGKNRLQKLIEKLLFCAMIEARSCERFRILSEQINDKELSKFYYNLMKSEANHYSMFLLLAKKYGNENLVEKQWNELLTYESKIIANFGKKEYIHG